MDTIRYGAESNSNLGIVTENLGKNRVHLPSRPQLDWRTSESIPSRQGCSQLTKAGF